MYIYINSVFGTYQTLPWSSAVNKTELLFSRLDITKILSIICLILSRKTEIDNEIKPIKAINSPTTPTDYV